MYLARLGLVRFHHDLPMLQYRFSKLGPEGIAELLQEAGETETDEQRNRRRAWRRFTAAYGLPDPHALGQSAARGVLAALAAGRVPRWALNALPPLDEIRDAAGEVRT